MFVPTKASMSKAESGQNVSHEAVTFRKRKGSIKKIENEASEPDAAADRKRVGVDATDMKRLRYEIIKFGASGFKGEQKEETNAALMVSLGAVPPKKGYKNYKELQSERKKEMERRMNEKNTDETKYRLLSQKGRPSLKTQNGRKRGMKGLLNVYGEVKRRKGKRKKRAKT